MHVNRGKKQATSDRQNRKLGKSKGKLVVAHAPLSTSSAQSRNSGLGENSRGTENLEYEEIEPIEPIEIPVDDVHSSEEDFDLNSKNIEGKYLGNGEKINPRKAEQAGIIMDMKIPPAVVTPQKEIDPKGNGDGKIKGDEEGDEEEGDEEKVVESQ